MVRLKWWMRIVGVFYVILGIGFIPPLNELRIRSLVPITAGPETIEYKALIDWTFVFGLDLLVIGAMLLYGARHPLRNIILVQTVVLLELIRGVLDDIYYISRGYASAPIYVGFIVVHLVIIVTGVLFWRQAQREQEAGQVTWPAQL
ncbi:MAG TPA: BphX family protein [Chloroflexia bacterium]